MNGPVSHLTATIRLERRSDGTLLVQLPGNLEQLEVFPLRLFPLSEPQKWIALLNPEGREVALLDSLENLLPAARELLDRKSVV